MSFLRHPEIYRPMWSSQRLSLGATTAAAPTHRLDEFPAGYSLAGCAPALPASASPADHQFAVQSFCRSSIFQRTANSVLTVCVKPGGKRSVVCRYDVLPSSPEGAAVDEKRYGARMTLRIEVSGSKIAETRIGRSERECQL